MVDKVGPSLRDRIGELVFGVEMTHAIEIEEPKTIPEARCNPVPRHNYDLPLNQ
jgi:hypothetical protein